MAWGREFKAFSGLGALLTCASSYENNSRDIPPRAVWALEQAGVHPLLARLYAARGIRAQDELDDALARLLPPRASRA